MNFAKALETFKAQTAVLTAVGEGVDYQTLAALADEVFASSDAPPEPTLVAIECRNSLTSIAAYLGALRAGMPALLVDADLDAELKACLFAHYHISWCYTGDGQWQYSKHPRPVLHPELALLLSTSGSTGSQKLVRLSLHNLHANASAIAQYLCLTPNERPITLLPIHYSYGLSVINSHLLVGACIALTDESITAKAFWDYAKEAEITSFAGVPTTYHWLKRLRFERMSLPALRYFTQAGGRLDPDSIAWFADLAKRRGQRFYVMYGQTEATARMAYLPPEVLAGKIGSIGIAIPGGRFELVDEAGNLIEAAHTQGELRYHGENVMLGYATKPTDLALPDVQQGVLATGDVGWRDEAGFYYISGRLQRFIKIFGHRLGLDEMESWLQNKGYEVVVTGEDEALYIAVQDAALLQTLAEYVCTRYRLHRSVVHVRCVAQFPVTRSGKIAYAQLLATLKEGG